jgi:O-antigen ligase/Tfp pilus assembly protein PilF
MEGLVTLLHLLAYFFVLTSFIKSERIWDKLIKTSIGASLLIGGRGFLQLFGLFITTQSGSRLDATFGNASYLAIYMLFHIFLTAYLLSKHEGEKFVKWIYGLIIAFQAFILIFTATRGAILALFGSAGLTFLLIAIFEKERIKLKKVSIGILIGLILLGAIFFFARDSKLVQGIEPLRRLADISLTEKTTLSRFLIWDMAYQGFKEKPILGWGQENFIFVFEKYYNPAMYGQEQWFDRAHNIFFDWLIAGGALGLLAYLSIFLFAFVELRRSESLSIVQKSLFVSVLAGYFVHNFFVFDNIGSYILFILVLSLIHFHSKKKEEEKKDHINPSLVKILTPAIVILTLFSIYFFNAKGILASRTLIQAISPQEEGVEKNLDLFKKALSYDTYGNQEIRERLTSSIPNLVNADIPQEMKEAFVILGQEEMQKQIDSNPISVRHLSLMAGFLDRIKFYNEAVPYLEKAIELSPKKQQTYFEYVSNRLSLRDFDKAIDLAKTAFELDENFDDARKIYATVLIYAGQSLAAEDLISERYGEEIVGDDRLAKAYFEKGQINKSILSWQKLIEEKPNNLQPRTSLAAVYLAGGFRVEAVEELRKAIEMDPNFKEQGEFFIREIEAGRNP